jgi:hypothetical protein
VEQSGSDEVEYRGVATPDLPEKPNRLVSSSINFHGSMYYCKSICVSLLDMVEGLLTIAIVTGVLMSAAALTLLEEDHDIKEGGVWTAACLGQGMKDRLEQGKVHFESKTISI